MLEAAVQNRPVAGPGSLAALGPAPSRWWLAAALVALGLWPRPCCHTAPSALRVSHRLPCERAHLCVQVSHLHACTRPTATASIKPHGRWRCWAWDLMCLLGGPTVPPETVSGPPPHIIPAANTTNQITSRRLSFHLLVADAHTRSLPHRLSYSCEFPAHALAAFVPRNSSRRSIRLIWPRPPRALVPLRAEVPTTAPVRPATHRRGIRGRSPPLSGKTGCYRIRLGTAKT